VEVEAMWFRYASLISASTLLFAATANAAEKTPGDSPPGMVWIPGGEFAMGAVTNGHGSGEMPMPSNDAEPIHRVRVDGFWMDKTTVTNEEFEKFVKATGYVHRQKRNSPPLPRRI
jgi:formylglycine-generating enzyme